MQHGTSNDLLNDLVQSTPHNQTTVFSNAPIFQCRCSIANLYCVYIWRIFVKAMRPVDDKQKIKHKGPYIWQPVDQRCLFSPFTSTQYAHSHTLIALLNESCLLAHRVHGVVATKHYTDYSFVLVLQELHIPPGNLSCTPRDTCTPVWKPLCPGLRLHCSSY